MSNFLGLASFQALRLISLRMTRGYSAFFSRKSSHTWSFSNHITWAASGDRRKHQHRETPSVITVVLELVLLVVVVILLVAVLVVMCA